MQKAQTNTLRIKMCKVYNSIGSLTNVKQLLQLHNITGFNSLNEVIIFQKGYYTNKQQLISEHECIIEQEKNNLKADIAQLDSTIKTERTSVEQELREEIESLEQRLNNFPPPSNILQRLSSALKKWKLRKKVNSRKLSFDSNVAYSIQTSVEVYTDKNNRYQYLVSQFTDAVNESCLIPLKELERKKQVIDEANSFIYGALGEHKINSNRSYSYRLLRHFPDRNKKLE